MSYSIKNHFFTISNQSTKYIYNDHVFFVKLIYLFFENTRFWTMCVEFFSLYSPTRIYMSDFHYSENKRIFSVYNLNYKVLYAGPFKLFLPSFVLFCNNSLTGHIKGIF